MKKSQNTIKTSKRKAPTTAWKKGHSGNPGGRPKNQQSITYWLNEYGNVTPAALADQCVQYATELRRVKGDMTMFAHIAVRALMAQVNEPSPGLLAQILERTEGKVADKLIVSTWRDALTQAGADPDSAFQDVIDNITPKLLQSPAMIDIPQPAVLQPAATPDDAPPNNN